MGFKRGCFPIWTCLSFFVLFCPFPIFLGFSRFVRGLCGDFPDLCFPSFLALLTAPTRNSPERVRDTIRTFPKKKWKLPPVWKPPGLASLNSVLVLVLCRGDINFKSLNLRLKGSQQMPSLLMCPTLEMRLANLLGPHEQWHFLCLEKD